MARKTPLCNSLLSSIVEECAERPNVSFKAIAKSLSLKETTLSAWHRNFKSGKWPVDYSNTSDGKALDPTLVRQFVDYFKAVGLKARIVKRLLNRGCLKDPRCFSRQYGVLESLLRTYPNLDFWLYADFGGKVDDLLFMRGKNERLLRKKYKDFNRKIPYLSLQFKEECTNPPRFPAPKPVTPWDFYES